MTKRPNILLFLTDDQRFDTIHALGNEQIHTPNLDALVNRGTTFTHAHIPGGTCPAVCMPSRAMLNTGRTLFHLEREGQQVPSEHTTIGGCFRSAGYSTFGTGKWHNGRGSYARSFSSGDEIFFGGMADHWNVPAYHFDPMGKYDSTCPLVVDPFESNEVTLRECDHISAGKHSTELFVDSSVRFVKSQDSSAPFLMYVSLMAPHDPRTMPEEFLKMYDPAKIELPDNFLSEHPIDTGALKVRDEMLAAFPRDPEEIKKHIAEYYAIISHLDHEFGRLVETLREEDKLDHTIIVLAGDNGLAIGQHGLMGKQNLYEHSVRVPLVFAGPGIPEDQQRSDPTYLLDIFPTLCELTDIEIPESVEGHSLAGSIRESTRSARSSLYLAYGDSIRGVSNGRHKLIEYASGDTQLFDLSNDSGETNNIAQEDEAANLLQQMRTQLLTHSQDWDDKSHPTGRVFWSKRCDLTA
ncbi:MAG: sulfatase-like hydrolase/transferase [Verrucomicrobiota bacterium]